MKLHPTCGSDGVANVVLLFIGLLSLVLGGREGPLPSQLAAPTLGEEKKGK